MKGSELEAFLSPMEASELGEDTQEVDLDSLSFEEAQMGMGQHAFPY